MPFAVGFTTRNDERFEQATNLASLLHLPLVDVSELLKKAAKKPTFLPKHNIYNNYTTYERCNNNCASHDYDLLLIVMPERLELHQTTKRTNPVFVDFLSPAMRYRLLRGGGRKQLLAKAIGIKGSYVPSVLDVTAGLGKDAFVLASLGCRVHMVERSPIIGALLQDGLMRLQKNLSALRDQILCDQENGANNNQENNNKLGLFSTSPFPLLLLLSLDLRLTIADAITFMDDCLSADPGSQSRKNQTKTKTENGPKLNFCLDPSVNPRNGGAVEYSPDVIYLDPMYPLNAQQRKTSLNKEEMRIVKMIVGDDSDAAALFLRAIQLATKRVVVKRPRAALPIIADAFPDLTFEGSSCRYDVYFISNKHHTTYST